jgi:hypothetical protein
LGKGVYPVHNRYPVKGGRVVFPESEKTSPGSIREKPLGAIGGETGVAVGNGLYFAGVFSLDNWPNRTKQLEMSLSRQNW